ncbi:IclR family transcriptional regulator [Pseudomonas taiwanensis]|uniref:IclR family transcriptional regulator n=1 Tax=Pseudomonas taiwanensis TaxID=470150 RepID=UPI000675BCEB|nr:IclR family transcriptional regulator [Pseudomonas taiwanensis]
MSEDTVRAVARALSILQTFKSDDKALTLSEIARRAELNKMTAMRLLATLEQARFVDRLPSGGYRLGGAVIGLAHVYNSALNLEEYVQPSLERLAFQSGESAAFYRREADHRVCLFRVDSQHRVRAQTQVGDRVPLPRGAFGRVLTRYEDDTVTESAGVIITFADNDPDLATVAAPVFGHGPRLLGAIGVSVPIYRASADGIQKLVTNVIEEAIVLTNQLGGDSKILRRNHLDGFVFIRCGVEMQGDLRTLVGTQGMLEH